MHKENSAGKKKKLENILNGGKTAPKILELKTL